MKTPLFISLLFSTIACLAQPNLNSMSITHDLGQAVNGVQLSINLTNDIIPLGSTFSIYAEMTNSSTNAIYIGESSPEMDFTVFLICNNGNKYQLTPTPLRFTRLMRAKLNPGNSRKWAISVRINHYFQPPGIASTNKNVPPGDYVLKVIRKFSINDNSFELVSNLLNIQVR